MKCRCKCNKKQFFLRNVPVFDSKNPKCLGANSLFRETQRGILANVLDWDIVVSKFTLQSCYYVHFQPNALEKGMNAVVSLAFGEIVSQLYLQKEKLWH